MKYKMTVVMIFTMLLIMCGCESKSPLIGVWSTGSSLIGYSVESESPYEVSVSFSYENHADEHHFPVEGSRRVDFYYSEDDSTLTVWQGTETIVYEYSISKQSGDEVMTLTSEDGATISLIRVSDRPFGIR